MNDLTRSGQIMYIHEIDSNRLQSYDDVSVRVLGQLFQYDAASARGILKDNDHQLEFSTELLKYFPFRIGDMFQLIGELRYNESLCLVVRVFRNIEGLDRYLYDKALALKRSFEQHALAATQAPEEKMETTDVEDI